jgi:hypothetical protein
MEMSACMSLVGKMSDADADNLIERVDALIAAGMAPQDAQRMATADLAAEIDA